MPSTPVIPDIRRNIVLYNIYNDTGLVSGSRPIVDSNGSQGSPWPLVVQRPDGSSYETGLMIQVIGCSLSTTKGIATLDAVSNMLIAEYAEEEEEEVIVDVLYEVEDDPPSYPEEKAPLVENTQA